MDRLLGGLMGALSSDKEETSVRESLLTLLRLGGGTGDSPPLSSFKDSRLTLFNLGGLVGASRDWETVATPGTTDADACEARESAEVASADANGCFTLDMEVVGKEEVGSPFVSADDVVPAGADGTEGADGADSAEGTGADLGVGAVTDAAFAGNAAVLGSAPVVGGAVVVRDADGVEDVAIVGDSAAVGTEVATSSFSLASEAFIAAANA